MHKIYLKKNRGSRCIFYFPNVSIRLLEYVYAYGVLLNQGAYDKSCEDLDVRNVCMPIHDAAVAVYHGYGMNYRSGPAPNRTAKAD